MQLQQISTWTENVQKPLEWIHLKWIKARCWLQRGTIRGADHCKGQDNVFSRAPRVSFLNSYTAEHVRWPLFFITDITHSWEQSTPISLGAVKMHLRTCNNLHRRSSGLDLAIHEAVCSKLQHMQYLHVLACHLYVQNRSKKRSASQNWIALDPQVDVYVRAADVLMQMTTRIFVLTNSSFHCSAQMKRPWHIDRRWTSSVTISCCRLLLLRRDECMKNSLRASRRFISHRSETSIFTPPRHILCKMGRPPVLFNLAPFQYAMQPLFFLGPKYDVHTNAFLFTFSCKVLLLVWVLFH